MLPEECDQGLREIPREPERIDLIRGFPIRRATAAVDSSGPFKVQRVRIVGTQR